MPPLANQKHEKFCQGVISGLNATAAYTSVYGDGKSNNSASARLSANVSVASRINELKHATAKAVSGVIIERTVTDLRERETRIGRLADLARRIEQTIHERAVAHSADQCGQNIPGGSAGIVIPVESGGWKADTALLRELRATYQQIAIEAGQWTEKRQLTGAGPNGEFEFADTRPADVLRSRIISITTRRAG